MKRFEVLGIIFLTGALLVAASFLIPACGEGGEGDCGQKIAFINPEELFDFEVIDNTEKVDSIIAALESKGSGINERLFLRSNILDDALFEPSEYFVNPETSNGKALDNFFAALEGCDTALVRVGHYGDSQLEGDRVTSLLRILFQSKFSGNGVGYVPMDDITSPVSYARTASRNWVRYTVFHNKSSKGLYSPGGTAFRYTFFIPPGKRDSITENGDTIKIETPGASFSNATLFLKLFRGYSQAYIWYGKAEEPCHMEVYSSTGGELLAEMDLDNPGAFNVTRIPLSSAATSLRFVFSGPSPEIYGLSFDPAVGVQFDNYGLRGHSGDGLMLIRSETLGMELRMINARLAILQFGGNVTPYVKNEKNVEYIKGIYDNLYRHFRIAFPEASVLVIGVNDVARHVGSGYASYPMIGRIRDVQKEVALKNGCAFFDLYEMMGGENSVLAWNNKGLASRDGHFSDRGRELVSNEIFSSIMAEYNRYLIRTRRAS